MHPRYPKVFSPIRVGPIELPNRYYFSPHGLPLTVGTAPSNDLVAYTTERVKDGGCGLVILSCTVHDRGRHYQPCPYSTSSIPSFRALADAVHDAGGKIFAQLWYWWGSMGHWQMMSPPAPMLGPSNNQYGFRGVSYATHAMSKDEIRRMGECFRQSVTNLREAGFDGVEVHSSHGGLIEQFLSPYFNRRTDEYGGSLDNRMRLLVETLETCREAAAGKLAVGMRFNCDELLEGGYGADQAREVLQRVCDAGLVDFADLDVAIEPQQLKIGMPTVYVEEQIYRPYIEKVRAAAGDVPVLSVLGRITQMADAEAAIASGVCDMVGSTRELLAEPKFVSLANRGEEELGRTCIACNWCLGGMGEGAFGCSINPASYRERQWGEFPPAANKRKVVVVGGGPGGLEAARVAALRGHDVTLFEAEARLGGALGLWAKLPPFTFYAHAIEWWEKELERLGVAVRLGERATSETVLAYAPDAVIVATGAEFSRDGHSPFADRPIPGADADHVFTPEDILARGRAPSGRVVILDGEGTHASSSIAELLAGKGCDVTLISTDFAPFSMRVMDSLQSDFVAERLAAASVDFRPATWARAIGPREVQAYGIFSGKDETISDVDAVVLVTGRHCRDELSRELDGKVAQLFTIGDALSVRPFATAAFEGQKFARMIGEPDAPASVADAYFAADDLRTYPSPAG